MHKSNRFFSKFLFLIPIIIFLPLLNIQGQEPDSINQTEKPQRKVFKIVEEMPRFPGCEDLELSKEEKNHCAQKKMLEFLYKNLNYPSWSKDAPSGMSFVVVNFIIEKDGSISNIRIVRRALPGLNQEVVRVLKLMPNWIPGKHRGEPVPVYFNLPVRVHLE